MMKVDEDDTMFGADNDFSLPVNEEPYNPAFRPPAEVDKEEEGISTLKGCIPKTRSVVARSRGAKWMVFALIFLAWTFSIVVVAATDFYRYNYNGYNNGYYNPVALLDHFDSAGGICGLVACITNFFASLGVSLIGFGCVKDVPLSNRMWRTTKILFVIALVCTLLAFTIKMYCPNTYSYYCYLGPVGGLNIANVFFLLGASILSFDMAAIRGALRCAARGTEGDGTQTPIAAGDDEASEVYDRSS